jgi:HEAT repeat protein
MATYAPPLDQLLTLDRPDIEEWVDYSKIGVGPEHIPELIRLATDSDLPLGGEEDPAIWGPIHAWRALGALRATAAVDPLLAILARQDDAWDDWATEEIPPILGMIGPPAIPALVGFVADTTHEMYARAAAVSALKEISERHPDARAECIAHLRRQMEAASQNSPEFNGFLLADLLNLKAVEAAPAIEQAFAGNHVDESIAGDWDWARWELGLSDHKPPPKRYQPDFFSPFSSGFYGPSGSPRSPKTKARAKAKRKQAAKSRKRNRKRR